MEAGGGIGVVFDTTNFPPFDTVLVSALEDRRIYSIMADYHGADWEREKPLIVGAFSRKYGTPKPMGGEGMIYWGGEHRAIILSKGALTYTDRKLTEIAYRSRKAAQGK